MGERIKFHYNPLSRGRIVHWMLEEVGAPYDIHLVDWNKREQKSPAFLKVNPMGKIPAIEHRGTVVTETAAIVAYLADAFPEANLAPKLEDPARGAYYRWLFFAASCLEPAVTDKHNPRQTPVLPAQAGHGTYADVMKTVETAIAPGWVLGAQFSAADVYLAACLGWYLQMKLIDPSPTVVQYVHRAGDRPAKRKFDDQLKAMLPKT